MARTDETFNIQLTAYAEPKLTVLKVGNGVELEEVVDDKGNSLIPMPDHAAAIARRGMYYGGNSGSVRLDPERPAQVPN